ncbi:hypothetical protein C8Q74DRAFT_1365333 [Fomes fomentarius]|nr:hypothetical protein C8Q74DRAFT_1365333 [Fomes fomentarius]
MASDSLPAVEDIPIHDPDADVYMHTGSMSGSSDGGSRRQSRAGGTAIGTNEAIVEKIENLSHAVKDLETTMTTGFEKLETTMMVGFESINKSLETTMRQGLENINNTVAAILAHQTVDKIARLVPRPCRRGPCHSVVWDGHVQRIWCNLIRRFPLVGVR